MICQSGTGIELAQLQITITNPSGISGIGNFGNLSFKALANPSFSLSTSFINIDSGIYTGCYLVTGLGLATGHYFTPILVSGYNLKSSLCQPVTGSNLYDVTFTGFASGWGGYNNQSFATGILTIKERIFITGLPCDYTCSCGVGYIYDATGVLPVTGTFIYCLSNEPYVLTNGANFVKTGITGNASGNIQIFGPYYDSFGTQLGCKYFQFQPINIFTGNLIIPNTFKKCQQPLLVEGINLDSGSKETNPYITTSNSGISDNWIAESQKDIISGISSHTTGTWDSALIDKIGTGNFNITLSNKWQTTGSAEISIKSLDSGFYSPKLSFTTAQNAWASYNVTSGTNSKIVTAWNISILAQQSGLTSGNLRPQIIWLPKTFSTKFNTLPIIPNLTNAVFPPTSDLGFDVTLNNVQISTQCLGSLASAIQAGRNLFCGGINGDGQGNDDPNDDTTPTTCSGQADAMWSGAVLYQDCAYFISGSGANHQPSGKINSSNFNPTNCNLVDEEIYTSIFTGIIYYNNPTTGDGLHFNSYNYDYSGLYYNRYGVNPPNESVNLNLVYPYDFTSIDELVSGINNNLSGQNYQLWYPLIGASGDTSGWYFNGPLMAAQKINSNEIKIWSLRVGPIGNYNLNIVTGDRKISTDYLIPNKICLQGSNDNNSWTDIHCVQNIEWDKTKKVPKNFGFFIPVSGSLSGDSIVSITPDNLQEAMQDRVADAIIGICTDSGLSALVSKSDFINLICNPPTANPPESSQSSGDPTGITGQYIKTFYLTGFKGSQYPFSPIDGSVPSFINNTEYDYYRVLLDNFNPSETNSFYVSSINLFSEESLTLPTMFTGKSVDILGASYTGNLFGFATGLISGIDSITLVDGVGILDNYRYGLPSGWKSLDGLLTNPTKPSGYPYFVAYLTNYVTGIECLSKTFDGFYFHPENNTVTVGQVISGCVTGIGTITGSGYKLNDLAVTALLGTTNGGTFETFITGAIAKGIIDDAQIQSSNLTAIGTVIGTITGLITGQSGSLYINQLITGNPSPVYFIIPTGYIQATGAIYYNNPIQFDGITINGTSILFASGIDFQPPDFYSDITGLRDIINSEFSSVVSASISSQTINLTAIPKGELGNLITLTSFGSTGAPSVSDTTLLNGLSIYSQLTPSGIYSGQLNRVFVNTGIYITSGTGFISGNIDIYKATRTFTGLWLLITGGPLFNDILINYRNSGYLSGNTYTTSGITTGASFGTIPAYIKAIVNYTNSPYYSGKDVVELKVYEHIRGTGIVLRITGEEL